MNKSCENCKHNITLNSMNIFFQCGLTKALSGTWNICDNWEEKEEE